MIKAGPFIPIHDYLFFKKHYIKAIKNLLDHKTERMLQWA